MTRRNRVIAIAVLAAMLTGSGVAAAPDHLHRRAARVRLTTGG